MGCRGVNDPYTNQFLNEKVQNSQSRTVNGSPNKGPPIAAPAKAPPQNARAARASERASVKNKVIQKSKTIVDKHTLLDSFFEVGVWGMGRNQ